jgi:membrane fusion protein, multidrug efflux system
MILRISSLVSLVFLLAACGANDKPRATPTAVKVVKAERREGGQSNRYSASIDAATRVDLAFKVGGYVDRIAKTKGADGRPRLIQEGDAVGQNQELASLRKADFTNRLAEARAAVVEATVARDQAQLDFDRHQKLVEGSAIPKAQFDAIRSRLDAAMARITGANARFDEASSLLRDSALRAPFAGTLARRNLELGALAAPGVPVFTVTDVKSVKVVLGVPDLVRDQLRLGSEISVTCDAFPARGFQGSITRIAGIADARSHMFEVEITVPNPDRLLKPGMVASVVLGEKMMAEVATTLPLSAIVRSVRDKNHFAVFVVDAAAHPTVVHQQEVELGAFRGNRITVASGLRPEAQVVVQGASMLSDGDVVRVLP